MRLLPLPDPAGLMPLRRAVATAVVGSMFALAGCNAGPDYVRPTPPSAGYTETALPQATVASKVEGGLAQKFVDGRDIPGQWWTLFHSRQLDELIDEALKANPDLDAAQAALRQAQENVMAAQGAELPTVDFSGSGKRQRTSPASAGRTGPATIYSLYNTSVNVSYTLDLFGGQRRQIESLRAQADYQQFQLEATYLSLIGNVVTTAINEASLRGQIAATQEIIKLQGDQLGLLRQQFELGSISRSDVLAQEATLAQTQASLPPLQKQLLQARTQMMALVGRFPSQYKGEAFELASLTLPDELPVSLPSRLVEQRPDIRSAEARLHQASADIGVAAAAMLPNITLSADIGSVALAVGKLLSPATAIWSVAAGVTQPIFEGGTLLHQRRAAEAAYDQAFAQYRSTVLSAFQNVADALHALQVDAETLRAQVAATQSAAASLNIARAQFQTGATTYLSLLNAQQTYLTARVSLVRAQAARYADTAALFQALGGGWWNREDVAPKGAGATKSRNGEQPK